MNIKNLSEIKNDNNLTYREKELYKYIKNDIKGIKNIKIYLDEKEYKMIAYIDENKNVEYSLYSNAIYLNINKFTTLLSGGDEKYREKLRGALKKDCIMV